MVSNSISASVLVALSSFLVRRSCEALDPKRRPSTSLRRQARNVREAFKTAGTVATSLAARET